MDKPPELEPNAIYGITSGSFEHQEGDWKMTIKIKGDLCVYEPAIPPRISKRSRGKEAWIIEYTSGYGAHADGYRLKRVINR
jgi:hypothetical protein